MALELSGDSFSEYYYRHDCGIPYERNEYWLNFFDHVAKQIVETLNPKKVLDAGCAWGFLVEALRNRGVEAYGIDISEYAISNVAESVKPFCRVGSISDPFDQHYDLIVSIEVLEHMTSNDAQKAIENLCSHSERLIISSTPFDYKEVTHINVHPPEYWAAKFASQDFIRDLDYDASFITAWAALYTKRNLTKERIVYEYERSLWPLFKEKYDLRQHIAENQINIEAMEASRDSAVLEAQHYQNLSAINENLLVLKDAEIEALKSVIASNEARLHEINVHWNALVNSKTWKTLQKMGRFKDFPDLFTSLHQGSLEQRPVANSGGAITKEQHSAYVASASLVVQDKNMEKELIRRFGHILRPLSGIETLGKVGSYKCLNTDPQLILIPRGEAIKPGWKEITLQIDLPEKSSNAVFYFDFGQGFSETHSVTIPIISGDLITAHLEIPPETTRIRFDPCSCCGEINIKQFKLKPLTRFLLLQNTIHRATRNITDINSFIFLVKKGFSIIRSGGFTALADKLNNRSSESYDMWVKRYDTLDDADRAEIKKEISSLAYKPLISVVMPTYNTQEKWLRAAIESVQAQLYENWELCIADDCSPDKNVRKVINEYADKDSRIKYIFREKNGHISACSNSALSIATGEFVALLDHDDELSENAFAEVVSLLNQHPRVDLIYSDEDKIDEEGKRYDPYFKPDWNPELFLGQNYLNHLMVFRRSLLQKSDHFRLGFEGSQDWDLFMRLIEVTAPEKIQHIPKVLYHWRAIAGSTARSGDQKDYVLQAQRKVLSSHLERTKTQAELIETKEGYWRVKLNLPDPKPRVSILIPTKDKMELLKQCIESINVRSTYKNYEILVIDNQSIEASTKHYLSELESSGQAKVLIYDESFNYSAINNFAVRQATGQLILLLNNDIEVITPDWIEEMVSLAIRPNTGAVGAKLYYPDGRIQHAGVILGIGGVAGHAYQFLDRTYAGQMGRAMLRQNLSAVTSACLMVEKKKYLEVGGFDANNLKIAFNDIDFCLKLLKVGYYNVWTPFAELYHHESASRGYEDTVEKQERFKNEVLFMMDKWGEILNNDPAYNLNLSLERQDFGLAFPPRKNQN